MAEQKVKENMKKMGLRKAVNVSYKSKLDGKRSVGSGSKPTKAKNNPY